MSRFLSFCFVIVLLLSTSCVHTSAINGKWKGLMQGPNGDMELIYTFKTSGDSLAGSVTGPLGELTLKNGKVQGETFSFDISFNEMQFTNKGTVKGDSISLMIPTPGGDMELMLERAKE